MSREDELRALVRHLMAAREEEKARVARELHDEMGSSLTAVNMDLMSVRQRLGEDSPHAERLARASVALKSSVEGMRRIIEELRPSMLESLGLREAILSWAKEYADRFGFPLTLDIADELPSLPAGSPIGLFRIAQEALANAIRHSKARSIRLSMRVEDDTVVLELVDDGGGMTPSGPPGSRHGLHSMRERAIAMGGTFEIGNGANGVGTQVRVAVPVATRGDEIRRG